MDTITIGTPEGRKLLGKVFKYIIHDKGGFVNEERKNFSGESCSQDGACGAARSRSCYAADFLKGVNTMTKEQISEAVALLTLMSKLSPEERKRFLYMIEGAALVAAK